LPEDDLSRLGRRYARLGVDSIAGDRIEDLAELTLVLGPVTLDTYYAFAQEDQKYLLDQVLYLVTPCHQRFSVAWSLEDRRRAPQLGIAAQNSRLGLNSYLGALRA
jgi:predicted component of type VI protein secretion system